MSAFDPKRTLALSRCIAAGIADRPFAFTLSEVFE
jgi:hypothetical protein